MVAYAFEEKSCSNVHTTTVSENVTGGQQWDHILEKVGPLAARKVAYRLHLITSDYILLILEGATMEPR